MSTAITVRKYVWLVNTILERGKISLAEISKLWEQSSLCYGTTLSRSTFNRHKDAIQDIFDIRIECESGGDWRYFIANAHEIREGSLQRWMLNTLSINTVLSEGISIKDRILLESVPSANNTLSDVVTAIRNNAVLAISYKKYTASEAKDYVVHPYCLKLFRRRWYLLAMLDVKGVFRTFSLDRMVSIEDTGRTFEVEPDFDANDFYADRFGIMVDDNVPVSRVRLRAYSSEAMSLADLPLHASQKLLERTDVYSDFELTLSPTLDFVSQILSRGAFVEVLEPQWLVDEVTARLRNALARYGK